MHTPALIYCDCLEISLHAIAETGKTADYL